jgi:hypothetical protein
MKKNIFENIESILNHLESLGTQFRMQQGVKRVILIFFRAHFVFARHTTNINLSCTTNTLVTLSEALCYCHKPLRIFYGLTNSTTRPTLFHWPSKTLFSHFMVLYVSTCIKMKTYERIGWRTPIQTAFANE